MLHRVHPEEVPKTLAEFESWLKPTLARLQEADDFVHNVEEAVDDQVFRDAADLVTQAGIFGLPFMRPCGCSAWPMSACTSGGVA
jgi:hypothetical protein